MFRSSPVRKVSVPAVVYDIGYTAGKMAYDVLVNGADISTMDVQYAENVTKEYNADICSQLGITVPDDYTAIAAE